MCQPFNHVSPTNETGAISSIHAPTAFNLQMAVAFKIQSDEQLIASPAYVRCVYKPNDMYGFIDTEYMHKRF